MAVGAWRNAGNMVELRSEHGPLARRRLGGLRLASGAALVGLAVPLLLARGLAAMGVRSDPAAWAQAVFTGLAWWSIYRLERRRDDRDRAAEERAQAQQVSVYYDETGALVVGNLSDQPIRDVRTYLVEEGEPSATPATELVRIVGPRSTVPAPVHDQDRKAQREDGMMRYGFDDGASVSPGVRFSDAQGRKWDRRPDAGLIADAARRTVYP